MREAGELEESAQMIGTPSALISEGIAGLAAEILLGDEEQRVTAEHVAGTGVALRPRSLACRPEGAASARPRRGECRAAAAHERRVEEEAIEYLMRGASRPAGAPSRRSASSPIRSGART